MANSRDLKTAVKAVEKLAENNSAKWRQAFHLMPPVGWMNDPNGLCQLNGEYHIYFQYSPFDTKPGLNYWGHYTTMDFVNYVYHEPALCSDEQFDCHGVYSGCAYTENGKMYVYYTGNVKHVGDYDYIIAGREHNTILTISENGYDFGEKMVLMRNCDYPDDITCHVRDPKVWKDGDVYYMILGARRMDDVGEVLLYRSDNKINWVLQNRVIADRKFGYMWECPGFENINGHKFLLISPQGVEADGFNYQNVYQSGYCEIFGNADNSYVLGNFAELDHGFDFYAPQSFTDESGRHILIGWFGLPDIEYTNPTDEFGWVHCLTIPRELTERNGHLCQNPIKEMKSLRSEKINPSEADIFEAEINNLDNTNFVIIIKNDCVIQYLNGILTLKFGKSGYGRDERSVKTDNMRNMHIFCDKSSIEIFANDGETVLSSRFYPEDDERGINAGDLDITVWSLQSFGIERES